MEKAVELDAAEPYLIIPSTFKPGGLCRFVVSVTSTVPFELRLLPAEVEDEAKLEAKRRSTLHAIAAAAARNSIEEEPEEEVVAAREHV